MNISRFRRALALVAVAASIAIVTAPADAATASGRLTLTGSVSGPVTVLKVVCNSHVAAAKRHFFFDVSGTAAGGTFLFTGKVAAYSGPGTYHLSAGLLMAGGHYLTAHATGTISIGGGANTARVRESLSTPPGPPPATVTVTGQFTCANYTGV